MTIALLRGRISSLLLAVFVAVFVVSGCATSAASSGQSGSQDRYLLTRADLERMDNLTAYEAIRRLKPTWLRYRGQSVLTGPDRESFRVYLDNNLFGRADALSQLRVRDIAEIRFLSAREATLRFGTDHTMGAILITSGRVFTTGLHSFAR